MKRIILPLFFSLILFYVFPEKFSFKHKTGNKQRIEAKIEGKQLKNNQLILNYDQQYKTIRKILNIKSDFAEIEDNNYFYNLNKLITNKVLELKDESRVNYQKDIFGRMKVDQKNSFPTFRSVPVFPDKDIKAGDQWSYPAVEVQDLFSDGTISVLPINVVYTFLGYEEAEGRLLAKFKYEHKLDITNSRNYKIDERIVRVVGKSETIMYFDNEKGSRVKEEYSRDYAFLLYSQDVYEFIDNGERYWYDIETMDKEKIVNDIQKELEKEDIKDAEIKKDDKGIKLSIENLHFVADSTELLPEESVRLEKIAKLLQKYKNRGVLIIGHTTDKGTEKGRIKLSIERAKVITDYLAEQSAINLEKSSFGGKGGTEPIADNNTEEGMKKNRRVEIYILED